MYILRIAAIVVSTVVAEHNADKIQAARRDEISFIESTIRSMQKNQEAVIRSNAELDQQVAHGEEELRKIANDIGDIQRHTEQVLHPEEPPASFLQVKETNEMDDFTEEDDSTASIFRRPSKPMSVLERARAKATAAEAKFSAAMRRLASDREHLLKDEAFRRARASEETRRMTGGI
jgi:DNA repair exonuclease SbcCD ATPase subunit